MTKEEIRRQIIDKCKGLDTDYRKQAEQLVLQNTIPLLEKANSIAIYHAYAWEFNLRVIIEYCLKHGKKLYQPVAYRNSRQMDLIEFEQNNSQIFSVPDNTLFFRKWYNLDLVIMPIVAVDQNGYRLGKGGGYYDTTLASISNQSILKCAIGFNCQQLEIDIPVEPWDIKLDYFVTENSLINFIGI